MVKKNTFMEYKLNEYQIEKMKSISQSGPVMKFGSYWSGMDKQERANAFWKELADDYGFIWDSVRACPGKDQSYFLADSKSPEWEKYYIDLKAHEEHMEAKKPKEADFTIFDEVGFKKAKSQWDMDHSCFAPNKPGYIRANND